MFFSVIITVMFGCLISANNVFAAKMYARRSIDIHDATFVCRHSQNVKSRAVYEQTTIATSSTEELGNSSSLKTQDVTSSDVTTTFTSIFSTVNEAITCSYEALPMVTDGFFNSLLCSGNLIGDVCNATCNHNYYTTNSSTVCHLILDGGLQSGVWSGDNFSCKPIKCPYHTLPMVTDGFFDSSLCSGNFIGDVCNVTCNQNYHTTNSSTICELIVGGDQQSGVWSGDNFACKAITCPYEALPIVTDGFFDSALCSGDLIGDVCNVTCNEYYYTTNSTTVCELNQDDGEQLGIWSGETFACQTITCPYEALPIVTDGFFNKSLCSGNLIGDACNVTCNENYYTTNNTTVCELSQDDGKQSGVWSGDNFACQIMTCPYSELPEIDNSFFNISLCTGNGIGDVCPGTCIDGYYTYYFRIQSICENNDGVASWSPSLPSHMCYKPSCLASDLPEVLHGSFQWCRDATPSYSIGAVCNLTCDYGYFAEDLTEVQCQLNNVNTGSWSSVEMVRCEAIKCEVASLPSVLNGYFNESNCSDHVGDTCHMICDDGHYPATDSATECHLVEGERFGVWSDDIPYSCQEPKCFAVDLPRILHGFYTLCPEEISSYSVGAICIPSCDYGYFSTNLGKIECQLNPDNTTNWSPSDNTDCEAIRCKADDLPSVLNGYFNGSICDDHVGDECHMTCNDKHYPVTYSATECQLAEGENFGVWSDEISYSCQVIDCVIADLPEIYNGSINATTCTGSSVGDVCSVECNGNYFSSPTICEYNGSPTGTWSNVTCKPVTCPFSSLPEISNGYFNISLCTGDHVGDICPVTCVEGYYTYTFFTTDLQYTCENNDGSGSWNSIGLFLSECVEAQCSFTSLPDVSHGEFQDCGSFGIKIGTTCSLTCNYGYIPGDVEEVVCTDVSMYMGQWFPSEGLTCKAIKCDAASLPSVLNGYFNESSCPDHVGDWCDVTCNDGYYPVTESETECLLVQGETVGVWSDEISYSCEEIICFFDDLPAVVDGSFHESACTGFGVNDTCRLSCDEGLIPNFAYQTQCAKEGSTGYWVTSNNFECKDPWNETFSACLESEGSEIFNETSSLQECKQLCMNRTEQNNTCLSVNFNTVLHLCHINFYNQHTVVNSSSFQEPCLENGWVYSERIDIGLWTTPISACNVGPTIGTAFIKDHSTCQLLCSQTTGCCSVQFKNELCSLYPNKDEHFSSFGCNYLYSQRIDKNCMGSTA